MQIAVAIALLGLFGVCQADWDEPKASTVWMLGYNYSGYAYSPTKSTIVALRPGGLGKYLRDPAMRRQPRYY